MKWSIHAALELKNETKRETSNGYFKNWMLRSYKQGTSQQALHLLYGHQSVIKKLDFLLYKRKRQI